LSSLIPGLALAHIRPGRLEGQGRHGLRQNVKPHGGRRMSQFRDEMGQVVLQIINSIKENPAMLEKAL
jgi:hypothetical protein